MAKLIPDIDPGTIANEGERAFYLAASQLPEEYAVLYSYKYKGDELDKYEEQIREADFVIVHGSLGFVVVEVKQGEIAYIDGTWHELKKYGYQPLHKNPVQQAQQAMFAILKQYTERTGKNFPLKIKYAICFPECNKITGQLPSDLDPNSIILFNDLDRLEDKILDLFGAKDIRYLKEAVDTLINKILAPSFKVFAKLEDKIEMHNQKTHRILTEEQERILDETELDKRKIFFGGAGSGKTFLAMEKARRLAKKGRKVLLTCYNKNLANLMFNSLSSTVTTKNFHTFLDDYLRENGHELPVPQTPEELRHYFDETLPSLAFDHFIDLSEERKFDSIIVDEGQDFKEHWITCLETMVKKNGEFYIFADPNQSIFNQEIERIKSIPISKHRLTRNLRNTEEINKWIGEYVPGDQLKSAIPGGLPVVFFKWTSLQEEKKLIENEIGRLVSQGVQLKRITILSPHTKEKSSLAGIDKLKEWHLAGIETNNANAIRFSTIRAFKGLESDIVFLIGVKRDSLVCTDADIYVGGSRAKFLLYVFYEENWKRVKSC
ncbi:AAA family ATPase [Thermanaerosceptrum fracticalcis]|uniref:AAA family ATPase n=1 Tax=Thermanaerosceptrum fracticalcis TaxID=1712410 RepID=A0A7G6E080_THEFR|nr:UvrD-helicase domain-containing protein [Thermanaerosceptrum fracticalcis]QNB45484.1 AAA family ATPase [Thermanaerosceptrum fracticalcis]